ncbi:MAG: sulfatase-like hydrolase/transferase [Deltaproteobacteria bacterium]
MSKVLSVTATPPVPSTGSLRSQPPLELHFALGWALAGVLNVLVELLPGEEGSPLGPEALVAHAVDLGRHIGFGLLSMSLVWMCRRWLPASSLLGWLAFALLSLVLGALFLPTDLDGLAERLGDVLDVSPELGSALVVLAVGGAVPAIAWLTRQRRWNRRWFGRAVQAASSLAAAGAFAVNASISPGNNPSAHLYLSWLTAILIASALPRLELALAPARRAPLLLLWAGLTVASLWALFGRHSNSVMIQLARHPSSLHLHAVLHGDGGLDSVHAAVVAQAGPFFAVRGDLAPIAPSRTRPAAERPIVVLFSIDSLRADLLERSEGSQYLSELRGLAQVGTTFKNARAPGSMTKYTLGAISSGKYFSQQYWSGSKNRWPKQDQSVHLASVLSSAGVYTAAFPVVDWLENSVGILRGFERNQIEGEHLPGNSRWIDGRSLTAQLIAALEANGERRAFFWVHYLDSHDPYFRGGRQGSRFQRYLRSLRSVDEYLALVRQAIARFGLTERVLLLVISDHGEAFGEHGARFHGSSLYDELLRVPFVAVGASVIARSVEVPVSLIDLGPTILDWFGIPTPAAFMGQSLVPLLLGQNRPFARPIVAETGLKQAMLFGDGYKAIRDLRRDTLELYDLNTDPGELNNLSDQIDPERDEHVLLLRSFFQVHTYRENGYRVPYVK